MRRRRRKGREIPFFQPYILRHTALTHLANSGCDVFTLARSAGHSSITITQRYVHPRRTRLNGHSFKWNKRPCRNPPRQASRHSFPAGGHNFRHSAIWQTSQKAVSYWCERGDSNPHGLLRQILSLVRLPIPPLSHEQLTSYFQDWWHFLWHFVSAENPQRCCSSPDAQRRSAGDRGRDGHISSSSGSSGGPEVERQCANQLRPLQV